MVGKFIFPNKSSIIGRAMIQDGILISPSGELTKPMLEGAQGDYYQKRTTDMRLLGELAQVRSDLHRLSESHLYHNKRIKEARMLRN